jgi:acetyl-CoA/propionyl-CoA carboxylase biotin carboxyl carrier protein
VPTVVPFDRAVLADLDFTAEHGFHVYTRWIEEVLLKRLDPEQLKPDGASVRFDDADTGLHRTWIEWDGRRVEVGFPAGLVSSLGAAGAAGAAGGGTSHGDGTGSAAAHDAGDILASITGTVARWLVDDGAEVGAGTPVVVLEAMKMEIQVTAPIGGVVHIAARPGDSARSGSVLGHIES